ncbi:hypothetical protein KS4_05330 [Poriferisphaera corsica]|uniref:Heparan-alpha-glucosaminide N-acetyltransferase catalytic domain-containing protein n=1 Tax=Poriferisphaera corsica TaxID=2528020 RepID=A0A517YQM3_9BACT|nr:heparan-alpha-glucosaminide N-acetyltransferase domain-containing protein [Poriferisphaera corsica]QDU32501.1 hypothetical protein KS4_05330 [Poriferisphaera corsica]
MSTITTSLATSQPALSSSQSPRILSLDVTRGLIILLMIFVNDVASVAQTPTFLKHFYGNGMMLPDIVFGAFLFIVGMSMPLAFSKRLTSNSLPQLLSHILIRSLSLIVLGILTVAGPTEIKFHFIDPQNSTLIKILPNLWSFATYTCVFIVWHHVQTTTKRGQIISLTLRILGIIAILYLSTIYRYKGEPIEPRWWGILGLIGWAYLVCSLLYLIVRNNPYLLIIATAALYGVYVLYRTGDNFLFSGDPASPLTWQPTWNNQPLWFNFRFTGETIGSQAAITMTGILFGTIFLKSSKIQSPQQRLSYAFIFASLLAIAGLIAYPSYGINKPQATLSWCLFCSAITVFIWMHLYIIIDLCNYKKWTFLVGPAGSNPLFAYMLAPVLYKIFSISDKLTDPNRYSPFSLGSESASWFGSQVPLAQPYIGITKSIVFAFFVVALTGLIAKRGLRLKL